MCVCVFLYIVGVCVVDNNNIYITKMTEESNETSDPSDRENETTGDRKANDTKGYKSTVSENDNSDNMMNTYDVNGTTDSELEQISDRTEEEKSQDVNSENKSQNGYRSRRNTQSDKMSTITEETETIEMSMEDKEVW